MQEKAVRALLIDEDTEYGPVIQKMLGPASGVWLQSAVSLEAGLEALGRGAVDLILMEPAFSGSQGIEAFQKVHAACPELPIIILTQYDIKTFAFEVMRSGAQDYLLKSEVDQKLLARVINHAIERKQSERALRASEERFRQVAEATSEAVVINKRGRIQAVNTAFTAMFGYGSDEVIGLTLQEFVLPQYRALLGRIVQEGNEKTTECTFTRKDRSTFHTEVRGKEIPYHGETANVTAIRDITERKQLEQLKDEFVSTVSHELRTPLAVIREGVSQIVDGLHGQTTQDQKEILSMTLANIDRLRRIINDLLDISKIEVGKMELRRELVDMAALVREVAALFKVPAKNKGLEIREDLPKEKVEVYADRDKMIQVFNNLFGNALKFTEKGRVGVSLVNRERVLECAVSDTGKGISERDLPRVFSKFQQFGRSEGGGEKGTGLGLAITKAIVEMHQGKIRVESRLEEGTRFIFTLPKCPVQEVFKEYVNRGLKSAGREKLPLSVIVFDLENLDQLRQTMSPERVQEVTGNLEDVIRRRVRAETDVLTRNGSTILTVLPGMSRETAVKLASEVRWTYDVYLAQEGLDGETALISKVASFPEDGQNGEDLISRVL